jgi:protein TonB
VPVVQEQREVSAAASSFAAPSATRALIATLLPGRETNANDAPQLAPFGSRMGADDGLLSVIGSVGEHGPGVSVAPAKTQVGLLRVSSGVSQGMLLTPIRPVYPAIAKAAHVEGVVVVEAVISRMGTIESLRVVSGPEMLRGAALEAIREARYQPYRLNGEPVEVQTTITVNFRMGG